MNYVGGLDFGTAGDASALVIVEHLERDTNETELVWGVIEPVLEDVFHVVAIRRFHGRRYPKIASEICAILMTPQLRERSVLLVNGTDVGQAVLDLFWQARQEGKLEASVRPLTLSNGNDAPAGGASKKDLFGKLGVLVEQGRVKVAGGMPMAAELKAELTEFSAKVSAAARTNFEAPIGKSDDLTTALALCVYPYFPPRTGEPSRIAPDGAVYVRDVDQYAHNSEQIAAPRRADG